MPLYPLTFHPIFKERVWGGRNLETLYGKALPPEVPIGESWEMSDREGDVSTIANGPLAGKDLHWLIEHHRNEVLGNNSKAGERFPLLIKILDARETLSLQVHPPPDKARALNGEPKTELWYVAHSDPGAELFAGLRPGVTRSDFEQRMRDGNVAECVHRLTVKTGDAMFLPSGRVHALGSGLVIFEIQQNSDTTYRVFDWNRPGLDGKPRQLHIAESLASIDFNDFEPDLITSGWHEEGNARKRLLVHHPLFSVEQIQAEAHDVRSLKPGQAQIIAALEGSPAIVHGGDSTTLRAGQFCLVPAALEQVSVTSRLASAFLWIEVGPG